MREEGRIRDMERELSNKEYEIHKENERLQEIERTHRYRQNMEVYDKYNRLKEEKDRKEEQFRRDIIERPGERLARQREEREIN